MAPNNRDATTYHLARVAHWMLNRSVALFPTTIDRQNYNAAGAEYLLLHLQLVAGSDRLASFLQLLCYLITVACTPALARLAGAPRCLARWSWLLTATAPMAILQACSVQNDLVATVMAIAVLSSLLPYFHRRRTARGATAGLLGLSIGAAAVVKATSLLAVSPFLLVAALAYGFDGVHEKGKWSRRATQMALALALALLVYLPELPRPRALSRDVDKVQLFSFPLTSGWDAQRWLNPLRAYFRHVPAPAVIAEKLNVFPCRLGDPSDQFIGPCTFIFTPHEDVAGNPLQGAFFALALVVALLRFRTLPPRGRFMVVSAMGTWLVFNWVFKDNPYTARLHLPLLALWPSLLVAFVGVRRSRATKWAGLVPVFGLLAFGFRAAYSNQRRPPFGPTLQAYRDSYYDGRDLVQKAQEAALSKARAPGCRKLGIRVLDDGCEYPVVWHAMQEGIEVRNTLPDDPWPCVYYSDDAMPPRLLGTQWVALWSEPIDSQGIVVSRVYQRP